MHRYHRLLQGSGDKRNIDFLQRLKTTYPVGTPEARLIDDLRRQGFSAGWDWSVTHRSASYTKFAIVCRFDWDISWTIDDQHHLTQIDGSGGSTCL
jgi:hypothetical protein